MYAEFENHSKLLKKQITLSLSITDTKVFFPKSLGMFRIGEEQFPPLHGLYISCRSHFLSFQDHEFNNHKEILIDFSYIQLWSDLLGRSVHIWNRCMVKRISKVENSLNSSMAAPQLASSYRSYGCIGTYMRWKLHIYTYIVGSRRGLVGSVLAY